jgi:hypothetical protein
MCGGILASASGALACPRRSFAAWGAAALQNDDGPASPGPTANDAPASRAEEVPEA